MFKINLTKNVLSTMIYFVFVLTFWGCVTAPKVSLSSADIKYVSSKALIEDKAKGDSNSATIDLFYHTDGYIRLEVTALLGYKLGSLLMTEQQIQYAVHPQKLFVVGPFVPKTMKPLFKQELDPRLLWAVVFGQDLSKYGLTCQNTAAQQTCSGQGAQVVIQAVGDEPLSLKESSLKKITIENASLKFTWLYKSIKKHNKSYNETFVLSQPEEYRLLTIK